MKKGDKMEIINRTLYDSECLLKIFNKCIEIVNPGFEVKKVFIKDHITFVDGGQSWVGGYAPIYGKWIAIKLPKYYIWDMNTTLGKMEFK